jgi:hypothetical protein
MDFIIILKPDLWSICTIKKLKYSSEWKDSSDELNYRIVIAKFRRNIRSNIWKRLKNLISLERNRKSLDLIWTAKYN